MVLGQFDYVLKLSIKGTGMNTVSKTIAGIAIAAMGLSAAVAQAEGYGFLMGSYMQSGNELGQDDGTGFQVGGGFDMNKWLNLEFYLAETRTDTSPKIKTGVFGADLQWVFNRSGRFEPYLFAGLASQSVDVQDFDSESAGAWAAGAGFRARIFGDSRASLRGEYRHRGYDFASYSLDDDLFSLGIQVGFGRGSSPAPVVVAAAVVDTDGDGVPDTSDQCSNTPAGVTVDSRGCAVDSDRDGVADYADECPGTVSGATVDAKGCELDGDEDGVVDRLDECPDSAPGAQVDIRGCEIKAVIQLQGVNFESNSDRLVAGTESVLIAAAATLQKNPEIKVEVAGHTDSVGDADYNESLSARRAETVRDYLVAQGVDADRMTTRGYGESQPVADNTTADGKAANRRVVLRITER